MIKKYITFIIIFILIPLLFYGNGEELSLNEKINTNRRNLINHYRFNILRPTEEENMIEDLSEKSILSDARKYYPYSIDFKPRREFLDKKQKAILLYWTGLYAPKTVDKTLSRLRNYETISWEKENKIRLPFERREYLDKEDESEKLFVPPLDFENFQADKKAGKWSEFEDEELIEILKNSIQSKSRFNFIPKQSALKWRSRQILKFWRTTDLVPPEMKYDLLHEKYEEQLDERKELGLEVSDNREEELQKLSEDSLFAEEESRRVYRKRTLDEDTLTNFRSKAMLNLMQLYSEHLARNWTEKSLGKNK